MRVHFPERYEAHRIRDIERLTFMAEQFGLTYQQFYESGWDHEGIKEMTDIDNNVAPPAEAPKARRGRKPAAPAKSSQAAALEAALAFVLPVSSDIADFSQFVNLSGNMAIMYNGQIAAGHPIVEELTVSPQIDKIMAALKRCGKSLALTETEAGQLSIKGENLRVLVPCLPTEQLGQISPDAPLVAGDFNKLKEAFKICGLLASEKGERVIEASLLLGPNTCTGTNGFALLQYWHGIAELPPELVLPKIFCAAVASCAKDITGLGGTWNAEAGLMSSFTVWFDGGAWIKTQCYNDRWPSLAHILDIASAPQPISPELANAVAVLEPFIDPELNFVLFKDGFVQTNDSSEVGAQYAVPGLIGGKNFNAKVLKTVAPYVGRIDLTTYPDKAMFFGGEPANPIRGAFMGIVK